MKYRHHITLCSCSSPFYGENFKKHLKVKSDHTKVKRFYFCATHLVIGEEGHDFPHNKCEIFAPSKSDMLGILGGKIPKDIDKKLQMSRQKKLERKRLAAERKVTVDREVAPPREEAAKEEEVAETQEKEAINVQQEEDEDEEQRRAIASIVDINEMRKRNILADLFGEDIVQKKRQRVELDSVDLDASGEERGIATSTPVSDNTPPPSLPLPPISPVKKIMLPRQEAFLIHPEIESRKLKSKISRLEKALENAQTEAALYKGRYENEIKRKVEEKTRRKDLECMEAQVQEHEKRMKKAEIEVGLKAMQIAAIEKELADCEGEKKQVEERLTQVMAESDMEKEELRRKVKEVEDLLVKEREAREEFSKELSELLRRREEELSVVSEELRTPCNFLLHLELPKGIKVERRHCDQGAESTTRCFSGPSSNCFHVAVEGHNVFIRARNVVYNEPGKVKT